MTDEMTLGEIDHGSIVKHLREKGWNRNTCGALLGLLGGMLAPLIGSLLTAMTWITGPRWHGLAVQRWGTILLSVTIPLLLLGAHCLDLTDNDRIASGERSEGRTNDSDYS